MAISDTKQPTNDYSPCNSGGELALCCAHSDTGRFDGLCYFNWSGGSNDVLCDGCIDRTWKIPSCVKLCMNGICKHIYSHPNLDLAESELF